MITGPNRPGIWLPPAMTAAGAYVAPTPTAFTPTLNFGGAAVGMTYSNQTGWWTKIGSQYLAVGRISLSAKGSSTGQPAVSLPATGLDITGNVYAGHGGVSYASGMASLTSVITGTVEEGAAEMKLWDWGAGAAAALSEGNFGATSRIDYWCLFSTD